MIIYGTRATQAHKETIPDPCPQCQSNNCLDMYVFQRYAHIFWIPFFPIIKTVASQCARCKQVIKQKEMPASLREAFNEVRSRAKTPVWTFIGTALVGLLILAGALQSGRHDRKMSQLLKSLKAGDILELKKSPEVYTLYKIAAVEPDSVAILPLLVTVNKESGLKKLESENDLQFSTNPTKYSHENLSALLHADEILDVIRK